MKNLLIVSLFAVLGMNGVAYAESDAGIPEGLEPRKGGVFKETWIAPEADFTRYTKILLVPMEYEFRDVRGGMTTTSIRRGSQTEFPIAEKDREKLKETIGRIFIERLAGAQHFEIVDEPGPDVLLLASGLYDIVSRVPPEPPGRGNVYIASVGEATLKLEAFDSTTLAPLYLATEQRKVERPGRNVMASNSVSNWAEIRRWAERWATRLSDGLESIHA